MTIDKKIVAAIHEHIQKYFDPDGTEYCIIDLKSVRGIAKQKRVQPLDIETIALEEGIVPFRYLRNIGTIGLDGQRKLLRSWVAVVGVGGLGGEIVGQLARLGTGHIVIIDGERFAEKDLNRQLCTEKDLGKYKAVVVQAKVKEINSAIVVIRHAQVITRANIYKLIKPANVVVDGLDSLSSRFLVEAACRDLGIPFVHGAIAGFGGQIMTVLPEGEGLSSIYGAQGLLPEHGVELKIGTPVTTARLIATLQVQEVIHIITGIQKPQHQCLLLMDAKEGVMNRIELG
jgi:molybdopterin/thiamine biosynthesis adenylyltransferase